jgi:hypothetical protein
MDGEVNARLMAIISLGITWFTAGATGLAAEIAHATFGAQVNDSVLIFAAGAALTIGTGIFAFTFKLLLDVRTSQTRLEENVKEHERDIDDLKRGKP